MRFLFMVALSLAHVALAAAQQTTSLPAQDSALIGEVRRLIAVRTESYLNGKSAVFRDLIAPGYIHVNDSGARWKSEHLLRVVENNQPVPATPPYQVTVTDVEVRRAGSVVLADALVTLQIGSGAATTSSRWRDMNTLVRLRSGWKFAQHSETPVEALGGYPVVAAPDSAALSAFVGDYEWLPGLVERITQRGARLYLQEPAHPEIGELPLIAAGAEAFYPNDDSASLRVFVRDSTGRVTHYIARMAGGPVIIGRRIR
jgi:hypothetical protein